MYDKDQSRYYFSQSYVAEPVGTLRRELSQTVITTYNLFHEKQMTIVSISKQHISLVVHGCNHN